MFIKPKVEKSIAVLPFVNMSTDDDNEYFSDGITEEIINALTKVDGLKVIGRTSSFAFKGKNLDLRIIGSQLGVTTILEGSVRKFKNRVRISAQLINTEDGSHYWSKKFDRELIDIFEIQDEISLLIVEKIRENFGHLEIREHLIEAPTRDISAYELYLKARFHQLKWNAQDTIKAIEYYKQSIELDTNFVLPYFGAGICYTIAAAWKFLPYQESIAYADYYLKKGKELDSESELGHFAAATSSFWGKWDFEEAHKYYLMAIGVNSSFTDAKEGLAELYTSLGDFDSATIHIENVLEINPFSQNHYLTKGNIEYFTGKYKLAIESLNAALRVDPAFLFAIEIITLCYIKMQDYQALDQFLIAQPLVEQPNACRAIYKIMYPNENIEFDLHQIDENINNEYSLIPWNIYFQVYLGNHHLALDLLEKRIAEKSGQVLFFRNDPLLLPLHKEARFQELIKQIFPAIKIEDEIPQLNPSPDREKTLLTTEEIFLALQGLESGMKNEKWYQDPSLSLKELAQKIGINSNKLSWLLNNQLGKNFNEYLNSFRLEEFKIKALNTEYAHLTLLSLAYESGFNSKSVFNSFFKKETGMTPSMWVKSRK